MSMAPEVDAVWSRIRSRPRAALVSASFPSMEKAAEAISRLPFLVNKGTDHPVIDMPCGIIGEAFQTRDGPAMCIIGGSLSEKQYQQVRAVFEKLGVQIADVAPPKPWWKFW